MIRSPPAAPPPPTMDEAAVGPARGENANSDNRRSMVSNSLWRACRLLSSFCFAAAAEDEAAAAAAAAIPERGRRIRLSRRVVTSASKEGDVVVPSANSSLARRASSWSSDDDDVVGVIVSVNWGIWLISAKGLLFVCEGKYFYSLHRLKIAGAFILSSLKKINKMITLSLSLTRERYN